MSLGTPEHRDGFTMVEAIVIVAVLAILGGILTPLTIQQVQKSKRTRADADLRAIATACNQYYNDTAYWPPTYTGAYDLTTDFIYGDYLFNNLASLRGWDGPYLDRGQMVRVGGGNNLPSGCSSGTATLSAGIVDPWNRRYKAVYGSAGGLGGPRGSISLVCMGPNGTLDTDAVSALAGVAKRDDIVVVVTRLAR